MAAIVFCVAIILIPMQTKTLETVELTYIFVDQDGNEYNILNNEWHWAADDWSFLFEDENEEADIVEEEDEEYIPNKDYIWWEENIVAESNDEELEEILEEEVSEEIVDESKDLIEFEIEGEVIYDDCTTPWNNMIKHGESVLAYAQRSDVNTICNVQRRTCNDWVLDGSYEQASCREDVKYEYTRVKVISYNNKKLGELIQNPKYAKNDSAEFNTDGKINQAEDWADSVWNNNYENEIQNNQNVELTNKNYTNCVSPRWEVINHGQFVKAYESPIWFVDNKCKVELRLCLDWNLKWNYSYKKCEHKDQTSYDYLAWNEDITEPTPELMVDALLEEESGNWLFNWIWNLFR